MPASITVSSDGSGIPEGSVNISSVVPRVFPAFTSTYPDIISIPIPALYAARGPLLPCPAESFGLIDAHAFGALKDNFVILPFK